MVATVSGNLENLEKLGNFKNSWKI